MKGILYTLLVLVALLSCAVAYQFSALRDTRASSRQETCRAFTTQVDTLVGLVKSGERALPQITYYRRHPAEMAAQIRRSENTVRVLRLTIPSYC